MPPPGFGAHKELGEFPDTPLSGVTSPGSVHSVDSSDRDPPHRLVFPKRKFKAHKKVTPEEVRFISHLNAEQDTHALNDAEALWQMMVSPVYGDPVCLEEEFSELAIRFSKREEYVG